MQESVTYFMRTMIALGAKGGKEAAPRMGNELEPTINLFACKPFGPNDYVYLMVVMEPHWAKLCEAIGQPELSNDERFLNLESRREHREEVNEIIATWMGERTKQQAMQVLCEAGIPASATFDTTDLFNDPHLNERGFIHEFSHDNGDISLLGWPLRMSESTVPIKLAPHLGEHTRDVLKRELGLTNERIEALFTAGIVA